MMHKPAGATRSKTASATLPLEERIAQALGPHPHYDPLVIASEPAAAASENSAQRVPPPPPSGVVHRPVAHGEPPTRIDAHPGALPETSSTNAAPVERIVIPSHLALPPPLIQSEGSAPPPRTGEMPSQPWAVIGRAPDSRQSDSDGGAPAHPRPLDAWRISVGGGPPLSVTHANVVLGRSPSEVDRDAQMIVIPDVTRTVSKMHARLVLGADGWTVTDLGSTNGVVVVGADGGRTELDAGGSALVVGVLILGKATVRIFEAESDDTW